MGKERCQGRKKGLQEKESETSFRRNRCIGHRHNRATRLPRRQRLKFCQVRPKGGGGNGQPRVRPCRHVPTHNNSLEPSNSPPACSVFLNGQTRKKTVGHGSCEAGLEPTALEYDARPKSGHSHSWTAQDSAKLLVSPSSVLRGVRLSEKVSPDSPPPTCPADLFSRPGRKVDILDLSTRRHALRLGLSGPSCTGKDSSALKGHVLSSAKSLPLDLPALHPAAQRS